MSSIVDQSPSSLSVALKEWAVAVQALAAGDTVLLLRKGGIREEGGQFRIRYDRVLLYPTVEHQKPDLLKSTYATKVREVESGWHPSSIELSAWAQIDEILAVSEQSSLDRLLPFHIWNQQFVSERMNWKPHRPLYVLLLRTYKLPSPIHIPYSSAYGGCRSWIDLGTDIPLADSHPVLSDTAYKDVVATIHNAVTSS